MVVFLRVVVLRKINRFVVKSRIVLLLVSETLERLFRTFTFHQNIFYNKMDLRIFYFHVTILRF